MNLQVLMLTYTTHFRSAFLGRAKHILKVNVGTSSTTWYSRKAICCSRLRRLCPVLRRAKYRMRTESLAPKCRSLAYVLVSVRLCFSVIVYAHD